MLNKDLIELKEDEFNFLNKKIEQIKEECLETKKGGKGINVFVIGELISSLLFIIQFVFSPSIVLKVIGAIQIVIQMPFVYIGIKAKQEEKQLADELKLYLEKTIYNRNLILKDLEYLKSNIRDIDGNTFINKDIDFTRNKKVKVKDLIRVRKR